MVLWGQVASAVLGAETPGVAQVPWLACSPGVSVGESWGSPPVLGVRIGAPAARWAEVGGPCSLALPPGLEPEIQKLVARHKQEVARLRSLHEAELVQADQRAAQRCDHQVKELREHLQQEKEALAQQERERARQWWVALPWRLAGVGRVPQAAELGCAWTLVT